ncbi:unnamed protein product [Cladocopium goreaui]|uniref:Uncharacterized protein n=1 Tax=Cladocopium goreaui TaxID=2562237 RepID=A0A9P1GCM1_9DINO|nr:unnamed protein product [Cladocopium goreaui]|mmetsp:Transcript_42474/g.92266  ORF Transcript_42474/g.92266 Transcript_42474/m.92266 type:complete len:146 (-) Transcript_42474:215-652(-)
MQSDDVFPISRHNFQQLEEGDRGEIELLPAESESLHRLGFWQRCGVRLLCLVLVCYFLPMLSFIPLAIFGGVHMPSPWAGDYNHDAPTASVPSKEMPTGRWYWNLPLVSMILILFPLAVVFVLYHLKMRAVRRQQMIDSLLAECV